MAGTIPRSFPQVRRLLMVLLAIGLVLRIGGGCETMAAAPSMPAAHQARCAEMPAKPDNPVKSDIAACALCIALPDAALAKVSAAPLVVTQPVAALHDRLAGLASGPAPPPPKIV